MSKTYIIAGNSTQYDMFIGKLPITDNPASYKYVSSPDVLRGISDPHGLFIGTWSKRKDIVDIVTNLMIASRTENPQLRKILKQVMPGALTLSDVIVSLDGIVLHPNQTGVHMQVVNNILRLHFEHPPLPNSVVEVKNMLGTVMRYITNGDDTYFSIPLRG